MRSRRGSQRLTFISSKRPVFSAVCWTSTCLHALGWDEGELLRLVENGFKAAFVEGGEIETFLERIDLLET